MPAKLDTVLRREQASDAAFVRLLYHQSRAEEVSAAGWPPAAAAAFLDGQLGLQTAHFNAHHPHAERSIVLASGPDGIAPIGRCYIDRDGPAWRLLEIGLLDDWQGRGIGTALIGSIQRRVAEMPDASLSLAVLRNNARAAALYARLGFTETASLVVTHRAMTWRPRA